MKATTKPIFKSVVKPFITTFITLIITCSFISANAVEIDLSKLSTDPQSKFKNIAKDLYALSSYQDSIPAESLSGLLPFGFEVGVNASMGSLKSKNDLKEIGFDMDSLLLPRYYGEVSIMSLALGLTHTPLYSNASFTGFKLKYNILKGGAIMPALSINLTQNTLSGVNTLESTVQGAYLGVSKGFLFLTGYANIGYSTGEFKPKSVPALSTVSDNSMDTTMGVRLGILGVANLGLQLHRTAENTLYTLNIGAGI